MIQGDWHTIGEMITAGLANLQTGPFGTMLNASEYTKSGTPVIAVQDIGENQLRHDKFVFVPEEVAERLSRYRVKKNDIIFGRKGAVERRALIKPNEDGWLQGSDCIRLRLDDSTDPRFVAYQLGDNYHRNWLQQFATGATMPSLNQEVLKMLPLFLPDLPEQKAIAEVLSSLDDKIDLLHRQNKTLESLAQTLFRQWFIEEADDSWESVKVRDVCSLITKGTTPTSVGHGFTESGINFLKAESFTDYGDLIESKFSYIDEATHQKLKRSQIEANDLIITIAGTIGRLAIIRQRFLPANTNQAVAILRVAQNTVSPAFLYCLFNSSEIRNDFEGRVVHAVQPNLSLGEIGDISFNLPPKEKLESGKKELDLLFEKKERNNIQIRKLTQLRDSLLPKLMSGEIQLDI